VKSQLVTIVPIWIAREELDLHMCAQVALPRGVHSTLAVYLFAFKVPSVLALFLARAYASVTQCAIKLYYKEGKEGFGINNHQSHKGSIMPSYADSSAISYSPRRTTSQNSNWTPAQCKPVRSERKANAIDMPSAFFRSIPF
jgi:hypothetical protein